MNLTVRYCSSMCFQRLCDIEKWPRSLWQPKTVQFRSLRENADWAQVTEETFLIIRRTMFTLLGYCLFCWLALGAPDVKLIDASAEIKIPFANVDINFGSFLLIGPLLVIAIWSYLQIYVGIGTYILHEGKHGNSKPFLFNLKGFIPKHFSVFLLYWMGPVTVGVFTWKALPRQEAPFLIWLTAAYFAIMFWLVICRRRNPRTVLKGIWPWAGFLCSITILIGSVGYQENRGGFYSRFNLFQRSHDLYGADLKDKDLRMLNLNEAYLVEAHLENSKLNFTQLNGANLNHAFLTGADLTDADLRDADLSYVKLDNAKMYSVDLSGADLSFVNLKGAKMRRAKLKGSNLVGAELYDVDLSGANLAGASLAQAKLSGANLDYAELINVDLSNTELMDVKFLRLEQVKEACVSSLGSQPKLPERDEFSGLELELCP